MSFRFSDLSLRSKLISLIFTTSVVIVFLIGSIRLAWDQKVDKQALSVELTSIARLLGNRSNAALMFDDGRLGKENLASLGELDNVMLACLYKSNGDILSSYHRNDKIRRSCPPTAQFDKEKTWLSDNSFHIASTIYQDNQLLGWLYMQSDMSTIDARLHDQMIFSGITLLLAVLVTGLLAFWLQKIITRPIVEVTEAAREIEQSGEYKRRAPLLGRDEIGELAKSFNAMLDTLQSHTRKLADSQNEREMLLTRYRGLFDSAADSILLLNLENGDILDANPSASNNYGYTHKELLKMNVSELSEAEGVEAVPAILDRLRREGGIVFERTHRSKNGRLFPVEVNSRIIELEGEYCIQSIIRDITERKQTEEVIRRSQKMEAIGQLAGGVAHDFNNQLSVIVGYLDLLKSHVEEDEQADAWVTKATNATLRCVNLTRQMLAFSRRRPDQIKTVNINNIFSSMDALIARTLTPAIKLQSNFKTNLWNVDIDEGEFQDAILNLVINARDAMPDGGSLSINSENIHLDSFVPDVTPKLHAGFYVKISISDSGAGMDKAVLERIFEPFYTTKPEGKGTGLGLAMVYGFIQRSNGGINVTSLPGRGTTFNLYIPQSSSSAVNSEGDLEEKPLLPKGKECILIVDDEAELLELASKYLNDYGYTTYATLNAQEALSLVQTYKEIDVLFSDIVMPGNLNGFSLAAKVHKIRPDIRILLTSGYNENTNTSNGYDNRNYDILPKPYRQGDLINKIRSTIDKNKSLPALRVEKMSHENKH